MATPIILYDNRLNDGTPTATDTAAGYDVLNLRDLRPYTFWKAGSTGTKYITVDCGTTRSADTFGLGPGHNLCSAAAPVSVEISDDGTTWTEALAPFIPFRDRSTMRRLTAKVYFRHFRVKIVTSNVVAQVAVILFGNRLQFPYPPKSGFVPAKGTIVTDTTKSKAGHPLGSVIRHKPIEIKPRFTDTPRAFVEQEYEPFYTGHASNLKPFLWAWDLDTYPDDVRFAWLDEKAADARPVSVLSLVDTLDLDMASVAEVLAAWNPGASLMYRNSTAYDENGAQVNANTPRYFAGKFGKAVMIEEGTVNLFAGTGITFQTGWNAFASSSVTRTQNQTVAYWGTTTATRIQTSGGSDVLKLYGTVGVVSAGTTYTAQMKVYNIGTNTIRVAGNGGSPYIDIAAGEVKHISFAFTGDGVMEGQIQIRALTVGAALDFYAWQPQLEAKSFASTFHDSTRVNEYLQFPTAGVVNPREGTLEFVFTPKGTPGSVARLFSWGWYTANPATNDDISVYWCTSYGLNKIQVEIAQTGNNRASFAATLPGNLVVGQSYYIALRWKLPGYLKLTVYDYTGAAVYTATLTTTLAPQFAAGITTARIGHINANHVANCLYESIRISGRERTDAEVLAAYSSNRPLPVDPWTPYLLPCNGSIAYGWGM